MTSAFEVEPVVVAKLGRKRGVRLVRSIGAVARNFHVTAIRRHVGDDGGVGLGVGAARFVEHQRRQAR